MLCSKCGIENPDSAKFCIECATPFARKCPSCGAENPPRAKFCAQCSTAIDVPKGGSSVARQPDATVVNVNREVDSVPADGERKTVTALFADIKGSMDLMEDLDPEEARAIIDPALKLMIDAVHRYDGYIVQSTGDGILGLFGAPLAHEDHPQRALYAALRMQEEMRRYSTKLREAGNPPIEARVGINTGEAVVRSIKTGDAHTEYTPIGHSTSLAARMQTLAPTGSIAVTEATEKLCAGFFNFKALGPTRVKGVTEPINVFEVVGLGPLRTRLQRAVGRGLTKFVGREREMDAMKHAAELAKSGHGQMVAAVAEAGTGKSRLFFEFKAKNQSGWMVLEAFSVSHGKASAYLPVIELLHAYFDIAPEDDIRKRREKVTGRVIALDRSLEDSLQYFFALLGLVEGDDPLATMDGQIKRRRTLEAIKRILVRESLRQPLMIIFEDLHWIDEETQAVLNLLADSIANAKMLMLVNYRPEYSHGWGNKTYYTQLRLDPLGKESAEEMLTALLGVGPELTLLKMLVAGKTEGNPFFIEEMVQSMFEDGALARNGAVKLVRPLASIRIPTTVQAVLTARIDRLRPGEKDLLQTLAVIGKEFPLILVREVIPKSPEELDRMLSELQLAEFIYEQPASGDIEYTFKHALTQEVAHGSILLERRKTIHEQIGAAMEVLYRDRIDDHVDELAHHYERSANAPKGVHYLSISAHHAAQRGLLGEGIARSERALKLLETLPKTPEHNERELALLSSLGLSLFFAKGAAAPESVALNERTVTLSRRLGNNRKLFGSLSVTSACRVERGEIISADQLRDEILTVGENTGDIAYVSAGAVCAAWTTLWLGRVADSCAYAEKGLSAYAHGGYQIDDWLMRPDLLGFHIAALARWMMGFPDRALAHAANAGERNLDPINRANGLRVIAEIHGLRGELILAEEVAREFVELCAQSGIGGVLGVGTANAIATLGWVLTLRGEFRQGLAELRRAIEVTGQSGQKLFLPLYYGRIAFASIASGDENAASDAIAEALRWSNQTEERCWNAELKQAQGILAIRRSNFDDAEQAFRIAIRIAREQDAKSWELRATTSLARLLTEEDRRDEARAMLADIFNWFTEGFDTADLKDAKALLDELSV